MIQAQTLEFSSLNNCEALFKKIYSYEIEKSVVFGCFLFLFSYPPFKFFYNSDPDHFEHGGADPMSCVSKDGRSIHNCTYNNLMYGSEVWIPLIHSLTNSRKIRTFVNIEKLQNEVLVHVLVKATSFAACVVRTWKISNMSNMLTYIAQNPQTIYMRCPVDVHQVFGNFNLTLAAKGG